jgi:putative NADH-flavin reductase
MKLVVFGATGGTGREVVTQALDAEHDVVAVARNPSTITIQHDRLRVLQGDVLVPDTLPQAVTGQDAVVFAVGAADRSPTRIYSIGVMNVLLAMRDAQIRRLICVSASGLDPGVLIQKLIAKPLLWWIFKNGYTDMSHMEIIVKASGMDWTILRPPRLTNNVRTGEYKVAVNEQLSNGWLLSRADLADYIVKHLRDPKIHRTVVELAY